MKLSAVLWAILVVAIWGINPAISKLAMIEMPTFAFLSLRYFLTALIFLPFVRIKTKDLKMLFVFALLINVVMNGLCYIAFQFLQPAAATLLLQTGAPISMLMACIFAKEKISSSLCLRVRLCLITTHH